jgi:ribonuclease G
LRRGPGIGFRDGVKIEIILTWGPEETRAALLESGHLAELFIERSQNRSILGNLYLGKVSNVLPGLQSAFVDIGGEREAFLYGMDLIPADPEGDSLPPEKVRSLDILSRLQVGQDLLVQVVKESLGGKGPRVTTQISLPGRGLVYLPEGSGRWVSRRIGTIQDRERLKAAADAIGGEGGFIVRTAAASGNSEELLREAESLRRCWSDIRDRLSAARAPECLHREEDLAVKILRDLLIPEVSRVLVDDAGTLQRCRDYAHAWMPHLLPRLELYEGEEPVFDAFGIEEEIRRALRRRVWLPSGGYLVIQPTEALVAIDVNTGKYVGKKGFEETALVTNLEAAREIVRQIRLRDLGGILVIDFIDMPTPENRRILFEALELALKSDRARSRVLQISEFGLVEITRQRIRLGLESLLCSPCPTCRGTGRLRNPEALRLEIQRECRRVARLAPEGGLLVRVHPDLAAAIRAHWAAFLEAAGKSPEEEVILKEEPGFHPEEYAVLCS